MRVTLNGKLREIREGITLAELLKDIGILPERVACEVNLNVIRRTDYEKIKISGGDKIEVVQIIGGGLRNIVDVVEGHAPSWPKCGRHGGRPSNRAETLWTRRSASLHGMEAP